MLELSSTTGRQEDHGIQQSLLKMTVSGHRILGKKFSNPLIKDLRGLIEMFTPLWKA